MLSIFHDSELKEIKENWADNATKRQILERVKRICHDVPAFMDKSAQFLSHSETLSNGLRDKLNEGLNELHTTIEIFKDIPSQRRPYEESLRILRGVEAWSQRLVEWLNQAGDVKSLKAVDVMKDTFEGFYVAASELVEVEEKKRAEQEAAAADQKGKSPARRGGRGRGKGGRKE